MTNPFHIMILSVGSLLGQNILDSIEGHRRKLRVTGVDSSANNPRIFRCDKAFIAPMINTAAFGDFLCDLSAKELPDMILPGRDHDVIALAELAGSSPDMQKRIPCGRLEAAHIMNDKGLSYTFAQENGLPFAATYILQKGCIDNARSWAKEHGFPLLAKPQQGFGSLGIRIICDERQLDAFLSRNHQQFVLQEMIDFNEERRRFIEDYLREADSGIPLFMHVPDEDQFAGQAVIGPDGSVGKIFTSRNLMVIGRCERSAPWDDPALISTTRAFAQAIAAVGWRGMFNLQCRKTGTAYIANEMNGRMSGSTSARRWLGYDEVRELILAFYQVDIGANESDLTNTQGTVYRSLTDDFVSQQDYETLVQKGMWERHIQPGKTGLTK